MTPFVRACAYIYALGERKRGSEKGESRRTGRGVEERDDLRVCRREREKRGGGWEVGRKLAHRAGT